MLWDIGLYEESFCKKDKCVNAKRVYIVSQILLGKNSSLEFRFMRTLKIVWLTDVGKVKRKAEVLDDGDEIKLTFRVSDDKVTIDSPKIPEKINSES